MSADPSVEQVSIASAFAPGAEPPMVIVGSGECGARTAMELRLGGWEGGIVLIGDEPTHPYERPPLSKAALVGIDELVDTTVFTAVHLAEARVEYHPGRTAVKIDREAKTVLLDDGAVVPYHRLLLATGARSRQLSLPGHEHALTFRTVADAVVLNARLRPGAEICVIGGGFIGLELAATAVGRGCSVTVLEVAPRMLGRVVPAEISAVITARHELAGVRLETGVNLVRISPEGERFLVETVDHGTVACDVVLAGVGAIPNTDLAQDAGLEIENGIRVDSELHSSDPDIFAAGDCASFPHALFDRRIRLESWRNALDQSKLAAGNMLGKSDIHAAVPWFWSDHYELGLQITGLPGAGEIEITRIRPDGARFLFQLAADGRLLSASGVGLGTSVAKDIRLAEMMISRGTRPDPALLADPTTPLKKLVER